MLYCPRCGRQLPDSANFCMICGQQVFQPGLPSTSDKSPKPVVGGILVLIGACFLIVAGIINLLNGILFREFYSDFEFLRRMGNSLTIFFIVIGIFCILGFSFGLTAGILALKRKNYIFTLVGSVFVVVGGALDLFGTFTIGILSLILGLLGLIFIAISKNDFDIISNQMLMTYQPRSNYSSQSPMYPQKNPHQDLNLKTTEKTNNIKLGKPEKIAKSKF